MPAAASRSKSKSKDADVVEEEEVEVVNGEGEEEVEEEEDSDAGEGEYEVEAILDHKNSAGKYTYLVAWKGYGPEHNTWEPQENVDHANALLTKYWATKPKTDIASKAVKRARPSSQASPAPPKKTPRQSKAGTASQASGRKTNGKGRKAASEDEEEDYTIMPEVTHNDDADKFMEVSDWDNLVATIETVERNSDGDLTAYLTMKTGERLSLPTEVVNKRCPQTIIRFYESHLKWKQQA